jgi:hypothetical protein
MTKRSYWLDLFTGVTWNEFKAAGGKVSGFRESRWTTVQKIKPGDYLLCYLTGTFPDSLEYWKSLVGDTRTSRRSGKTRTFLAG